MDLFSIYEAMRADTARAEKKIKRMREVDIPASKARLESAQAGWAKKLSEVDRYLALHGKLTDVWNKETDAVKKEDLLRQMANMKVRG